MFCFPKDEQKEVQNGVLVVPLILGATGFFHLSKVSRA